MISLLVLWSMDPLVWRGWSLQASSFKQQAWQWFRDHV